MSEQEEPSVRYCVVVQFEKRSTLAKLAESAPTLIELFRRWSGGEMEQLCRSSDGQLFGYLLRSKKPIAMMRSEFESCPATDNGDHCIIFEAGQGLATVGFSRAGTWLQRH